MRILHVSDLHASLAREATSSASQGLAPGSSYADVLVRRPGRLAALERAVAWAIAEGPLDAIVFTGDIADGSDAPATYGVVARLLRHLLAGTDVPVVFTPGNHDDRAALRASWGEGVLLPDAARPSPVAGDGAILAVARAGGCSFVSFDTSDPDMSDGSDDPERLRWLVEILSDLTGKRAPIFVCTHHHLRPGESDMPCSPLAEGVLDAARAAGATVLCGHTHHAAQAVEHGVRCLTAPSLSFVADVGSSADGRRTLRFRAQEGWALYDFALDGSLSLSLRVSDAALPLAEIPLN